MSKLKLIKEKRTSISRKQKKKKTLHGETDLVKKYQKNKYNKIFK